ncbi:MAG: hypothetical protein COS29_04510 [Candidatus Omnitrophica bacterium CG02_land_8_20_14_3_00__42_8]|nr:MAG: hypothetical protein COS29_04510 [Candidatus Omnitrophica bacterium CG02_land_8_20_14_3_00__42_8]
MFNKFKDRGLVYLLIVFSLLGGISLVFENRAQGDDAGDPYTNKSEDTIGAWYDETWQASGFYRTTKAAGGEDKLIYTFTTKPNTDKNPTYSIPPKKEGDTISPGVALSSDMAVTEWEVTGHLHFKSGL